MEWKQLLCSNNYYGQTDHFDNGDGNINNINIYNNNNGTVTVFANIHAL